MLLGALVDAGAPLARMQRAVDTLAVEPVRLSAERVSSRRTSQGNPAKIPAVRREGGVE